MRLISGESATPVTRIPLKGQAVTAGLHALSRIRLLGRKGREELAKLPRPLALLCRELVALREGLENSNCATHQRTGLRRLEKCAHAEQADGKLELPVAVTSIERGKRLSDVEAPAILDQRVLSLSQRPQEVADMAVRNRQVALPLAVAGIGSGEILGNFQAASIIRQRLLVSTQRVKDMAYDRIASR